ncbi:TOPRIM nucleotidyl transferase/hydrolase domain-containing protein [Streptomyces sp. NPDC003300]|uniref:TOPRIM nucleotidyl transferase/hydrolase domain-containing protein n=1 Tax=unclassified Streptomyces TaxID=2593676 RepID=UPI0033A97D19
MDTMTRFGLAVVEWAAGGTGAAAAEAAARELAAATHVRTAVLVEGTSDQAAVEALAVRRGRDLAAEGTVVVPLGGAMSIGRFLSLVGPEGLDLALAGLCDEAEEGYFLRALDRAGVSSPRDRPQMEALGFHVCVADLEEELIRSLGTDAVREVAAELGEARSFRIFQKQPAQRERPVDRQLRRFIGTHSGRKSQYAHALVDALEPHQVPRPLDRLLAHI